MKNDSNPERSLARSRLPTECIHKTIPFFRRI